MDLANYFENHEGTGILASADSDGMVDLAIYAKPHVINENTIAFVMKERLTHQNLLSNPHAAYMFIEKGEGYKGKRLYLTMLREEINTSLVGELREKQPDIYESGDDSNKYFVCFKVENDWPLVGDKDA